MVIDVEANKMGRVEEMNRFKLLLPEDLDMFVVLQGESVK